MSSIPVLFTDRLILRPFILEDAAAVQLMVNDESIASAALNIPFPFELKTAITWIEGHEHSFDTGQAIILAIEEKYKNTLLGTVALYINVGHESAELGYWLGKDFWNNGYVSEALERIIEYGFEDLQLNKIYASHFESNPASGKVLEKQSMRLEGTLRQQVKHFGNYENLIYWGILKEEWQQNR